jgi:hypothetical protein
MEKSDTTEKHGRHLLRILRPLFWWLILVLVMFGIQTHRRLMEKTRLDFSVSMQGQAIVANAMFDGKPAFSGQNIPLGSHVFVITYPKGEPFSTNLFVWYGEHNFGRIDLKRTKGLLVVTADPPAPLLSIRGPEWSVTLTNSSGINSSVPSDQYYVESRYAHWERADEVSVSAGSTALWRIAPPVGAVRLSCNHSNTTFQLLTLDDRQVETGEFPFLITELPEGNYKLVAQHNGYERKQAVFIKKGATNEALVEFTFGAAILETEPPGASMLDNAGREWGVTPINLPELTPGTLQVTLHRDGYEPVPVSLEIIANQTATFHTNLISTMYIGWMKSARKFMAAADYARALQAVGDAIIAKPDDAEAMTLQREATGLGLLQRAKTLGVAGDYLGGGKELTLALQSLPDNEEIKQLIADFKQHEQEQEREKIEREQKQIERLVVEGLVQPGKVFDVLCDKYPDSKLFAKHELKTKKQAGKIAGGISGALVSVQPPYAINRDDSPVPDIYVVVATQKSSNGFMSGGGERTCLIVVGQNKNHESQIIFKVLEYQRNNSSDMTAPVNQLPISENLIPLSPSRFPNMTKKLKAQLHDGVSNVTAIVKRAVGQTPADQSTDSK